MGKKRQRTKDGAPVIHWDEEFWLCKDDKWVLVRLTEAQVDSRLDQEATDVFSGRLLPTYTMTIKMEGLVINR